MLIDADDKLHKDITLKDVVTLTTYVIKDDIKYSQIFLEEPQCDEKKMRN